ncbi:replication factor C subunit 3-like [Rutidosis leptorrhynchoides]|uniref:replication factor C subunit 3-like n=1 Tax=Rutidosis leptorrhynchoides TaxID=125765 RepID=UPI003A9A01E8
MKSPVSPEPLTILKDQISNVSKGSSSTNSLKTGWTARVAARLLYKKKASTLTKENLEEFNSIEDKKYYSSPYYKGLLNTEKVPDTTPEAESKTTPIPHDLHNLSLTSQSSPYYKGLLNTGTGTGTTGEAESTMVMSHDYLNVSSPYYKGLLHKEPDTSPDRESHATTFVSSSSRTSFSVKMQEWSAACFSFKSKDEKLTPTMIKVYSTEHSIEESLRERVSESKSPSPSPSPPKLISSPPPLPTSSPPLSTSSPPPPPPQPIPQSPPTKRVVVNEKETSELKEEKKYFWADKYRPVALKDFICNKDKANELQQVMNEDDCCHFIFEGQAGVGKRTMIWAMLREAFGADKVEARDERKTFTLKGEEVSSINVNVKESSQHVEINLSELKGFEKHVIVELIKETNKLTHNTERCSNDNCRAIILYEADKLSTDALLYIRWVIERYRGCHKIFFCCQDALKLQPLKNICKLVQLLPPSNKEIVEVLEFIARNEKIDLPRQLSERIAIDSKNNLRQAIRSFEATWQHNPILKGDQVILTGWEDDIADIAKSIIEKQSPKQLYDIRRKLQNLIDHSVPPDFIFNTLEAELKKNTADSMHQQIEKTYKEYSGKGSDRFSHDERRKLIQHFMNIEEFIAKFMSCYKSHLAKQDMTESESQPP